MLALWNVLCFVSSHVSSTESFVKSEGRILLLMKNRPEGTLLNVHISRGVSLKCWKGIAMWRMSFNSHLNFPSVLFVMGWTRSWGINGILDSGFCDECILAIVAFSSSRNVKIKVLLCIYPSLQKAVFFWREVSIKTSPVNQDCW